MGIRDYLDIQDALFYLRPSKGGDEIPEADIVIDIQNQMMNSIVSSP